MPLIKACIPSPFELQSHADKVKTGDFGLATTFRDEGLQALGVGTRGYAAPVSYPLHINKYVTYTALQEQWNDGKYYKKLHPMIIGSAADVWGVGIIMHCAIRLNVDDEMEKQCYANAKKTWPVSLDYYKTLYPKTMIDLITKCLDVDPTKRIKAWDLCEAVDEAVDTFFQNPYLDLSEYDEEDEDDRNADKLALLSNKFRYQPDMYAAWA
jgi:serine/threonine protein kinase